jgi:spore coat protein U-like protein
MAYLVLIDHFIKIFNGGHGMKKTGLVLAAVTAGALAMATNPLLAALGPSPQSTSLPITANIQASCTVTAAAVAFGTYDPTANSDQNGSITIQCTKGTAATVSLDEGAAPAGRQMAGPGTDTLTYELYSDVAGGSVWGIGNGGSTVAYNAATSAPSTLTVFGRIPLGQNNAGVGAYADTVTVTVTF